MSDTAGSPSIGNTCGYDRLDQFPRVLTCLDYVDDDALAGILRARLWGQNCAEIASSVGKTRETIRMKCYRALKRAKRRMFADMGTDALYEDVFLYIFKHYDVSSSDIMKFFHEPVATKAYIDTMRTGERFSLENRKPIEEALQDNSIPVSVRRVLLSGMSAGEWAFVYGQRIPRIKRAVVVAYLKGIEPEKVSMDNIVEAARTALIDGGLKPSDPFVKGFHVHWQNVENIPGVLSCGHRQIRYYDFGKFDPAEVYRDMHLADYDGFVISTDKIIMSDPTVLERYHLNDAVELHNFLRHLFDGKDMTFPIRFGRVPILEIGDCNRDKQFRDLIGDEVMSRSDFQRRCLAKFGIGAGASQAYAEKYIEEGLLYNSRKGRK